MVQEYEKQNGKFLSEFCDLVSISKKGKYIFLEKHAQNVLHSGKSNFKKFTHKVSAYKIDDKRRNEH